MLYKIKQSDSLAAVKGGHVQRNIQHDHSSMQ